MNASRTRRRQSSAKIYKCGRYQGTLTNIPLFWYRIDFAQPDSPICVRYREVEEWRPLTLLAKDVDGRSDRDRADDIACALLGMSREEITESCRGRPSPFAVSYNRWLAAGRPKNSSATNRRVRVKKEDRGEPKHD